MRINIKGGRVLDPGQHDNIMDILIQDDKIVSIGNNHNEEHADIAADITIDATGKIVTPGLIDMHVHLREPGFEYKETIESGSFAAAYGGFTSVCAMPNTNPVNDNKQITKYIIDRAKEVGMSRVYPVAAISRGLKGQELCEYGELKEAGAIALSDDGRPVENPMFMRRAMEYAKGFNLLIISHCEELSLAKGSMNEGNIATRMGIAGIPNVSESIMVTRDIALCELTGARLHIAHVSTLESVKAIREAKSRGISVTAETAPHYFTLTDEAVCDYNTNAKMNPPLRTQQDKEAIIEALADGTIDVIATDHAPHSPDEKRVEFDKAPNGIIGLETSLPIGLMLVEKGLLSLEDLIAKMSTNPAKILGIDSGLKNENIADLTIIDPNKIHTIDSNNFKSLSRNTPFDGFEVKGKAVLTMIGGKIIYSELS